MPVFNGAEYLRAAIDSCLAQTEMPHELIVVDDGSTDDTPLILAGITARARLIVVTQANAGISAARNRGVAAATGAFVAFLDADDEYEPDAIARHAAALAADVGIDILFSDYWLSDIPGSRRSAHAALGGPGALPGFDRAYLHREQGSAARLGTEFCRAYESRAISQALISTNSIVIRRALFDALRGFDETMVVGEDYDLWRRGFAAGTVALMTGPPTSTYYKWRSASEKYERACRQSLARIREALGSMPRFGAEWRRLRRNMANEYLTLIYVLGPHRTDRGKMLPLLLRSIAAYPASRQLRYAVMMLLPGQALRLLHRLRSKSSN